ncbi:ImmA/IrrE family metallo-endopeptidase, partial [Aquisalimonas sp.]|uniref:ImmA/IrrE family metallo-endopeptidase n=1 Tax=Aquisalimonas sp. TaxID=1872621 RepID=UPI0025BD3029
TVPASVPQLITNYEQLEEVAEVVRRDWGLGENPIPDLIDTLEGEGLLVILATVADGVRFDGLAGKVGEQHVIVVSKSIPGDRQRLTLAHELGHRLLAGRLAADLDEETACNRLAGAFLLLGVRFVNTSATIEQRWSGASCICSSMSSGSAWQQVSFVRRSPE